jgi:transglutaminase-like putative cysteine protease
VSRDFLTGPAVPRYRITHRTTYEYQSAVSLCHNIAHLVPRGTARQTCQSSQLVIEPEPNVRSRRFDHYGNETWYFSIETPHQRASVASVSEVTVTDQPPQLCPSPPWEQIRALLSPMIGFGAEPGDASVPYPTEREFVLESPFIPTSDRFADYAWQSFSPGRPILDAMSDFTARIFHEFTFDAEATTLATPVGEVFDSKRGVCQDFAHLTIACLRSIGLAARYVSGYLETVPPPGQERMVGADASHAWVSIFAGELGWFDFDPTNNLLPGDRHITVAFGRDYSDVAPLQGVILGGGDHELAVSVDVARLDTLDNWQNTAI